MVLAFGVSILPLPLVRCWHLGGALDLNTIAFSSL